MIWKYKTKEPKEWSKWFAWKPVCIGPLPRHKNGDTIVWLQRVERKLIDTRESYLYEYRLLPKPVEPEWHPSKEPPRCMDCGGSMLNAGVEGGCPHCGSNIC